MELGSSYSKMLPSAISKIFSLLSSQTSKLFWWLAALPELRKQPKFPYPSQQKTEKMAYKSWNDWAESMVSFPILPLDESFIHHPLKSKHLTTWEGDRSRTWQKWPVPLYLTASTKLPVILEKRAVRTLFEIGRGNPEQKMVLQLFATKLEFKIPRSLWKSCPPSNLMALFLLPLCPRRTVMFCPAQVARRNC